MKKLFFLMFVCGCSNQTPIDIPIPAYSVTAQAVVGGPLVTISVPAQVVTIPAHPAPSATPLAVKVVTAVPIK